MLTDFEKVKPSYAIALVCIVTGGFALVELPTIFIQDTYPDYPVWVKPVIDQCSPDKMLDKRGSFKWFYLCFSTKVLGFENLLPYLFSVVLIPITYLFATELTHKRLVGIITILILVTSGNFYLFHSVTYEQSWVVYLFISLYLILKGRLSASIFYFLSIISKPLPLVYLPFTLFFIIQTKIKTRDQIIVFLIVLSICLLFSWSGSQIITGGGEIEVNEEEFEYGLLLWFYLLDSSWLVAVSTPLVIIKLITQRRNNTARILLIFILGIISTVPAIEGFTTQINHAYRFVPLIIFVGTAIGFIISNWIDKQVLRIDKVKG